MENGIASSNMILGRTCKKTIAISDRHINTLLLVKEHSEMKHLLLRLTQGSFSITRWLQKCVSA
ncbi:hypothetical protein YC2023_040109 [Brassica napus]